MAEMLGSDETEGPESPLELACVSSSMQASLPLLDPYDKDAFGQFMYLFRVL